MNALELLALCKKNGIKLSNDSGSLKVAAKKGAMTPEIAALLREHKDTLIDVLSGLSQVEQQSIPIQPRDGRLLPTSFPQQNLWLTDRLEGGTNKYNATIAIDIKGELDTDAVEQAITQIIERHEPLRTVFVEQDGLPVQKIHQTFDFQLQRLDFSEHSVETRQAAIDEHIRRERNRLFNLELDLMVRASFLDLGKSDEAEGVLVFTQHHIASDGWSSRLFIEEFVALYSAALQGQQADLPDFLVQYADFAAWQRETLTDDVIANQERYWQQQLADVPAVHQLPLDHVRPEEKQGVGQRVTGTLPREVSEQLTALAQRKGMTMFMLANAALSLMVGRRSNSHDVVIGAAGANRQLTELERLIGFFVNVLVFRTDNQQTDLNAFLEHVKQVNLAALQHQDISFEKLVNSLGVKRNTAYMPVFQITLHVDNKAIDQLSLPGVSFTIRESDITVRYDLIVRLEVADDGLVVHFEYDTALFKQDTIEQFHQHFCDILTRIAAQQTTSLADIAQLPEQEIEALQQVISGEQQAVSFTPVHQQILTPARADDDTLAVVMDEEALSWQALHERSTALAVALQRNNIQPGDPVVLCAERSVDVVAGMLAIFKTGAMYVPVDPALPDERIRYLLSDSGAKHVLTQGYLAHQLPLQGKTVITLEQADDEDGSAFDPVSVTEDSSAWMIYTSGSTGQPKGVVVTHGNAAEKLSGMAERYALSADDCMLCFASFSFDASLSQLLSPLVAGARVVIRPSWLSEPADLLDYLAEHRVTVMHLVPQYLSLLVSDEISGADWQKTSLRAVISGGDVLNKTLVAQWFAVQAQREQQASQNGQAPQSIALFNSYGPTETTITACTYEVAELLNDDLATGYPIGFPTRNTQCYVVDDEQQLAPVGVTGELWIGGAGVAAGYHQQSTLTAERFVANSFDANLSGRLYKTGDLVQRRADGALVFIGRRDNQLKLRGFRIEPGEIEAVIREIDGVTDVAVIPVGEGDALSLHGFVVAQPELFATLTDTLAQHLPDYMIPTEFHSIDTMPLTVSGKVDRNALAALSADDHETGVIAPRNHYESGLLEIWQKLLPDREIGVKDNFFDSGGHSLLATRLASQIRKTFKVDFSLKSLFEAPSIEEQALVLASQLGEPDTMSTSSSGVSTLNDDMSTSSNGSSPVSSGSSSVNIASTSSASSASSASSSLGDDIPRVVRDEAGMVVSFAQQRLWFIDKLMSGSSHYNTPKALQVTGVFDVAAASAAITTIIARHEVLRTNLIEQDGQALQVIRPAMPFDIDVADLSTLIPDAQQHEVSEAIAAQYQEQFDLQSDLMLRVRFLKLADESGVLLFNMHHIATDGWSLGVFMREFSALYQAQKNADATLKLADLPIQYADYAAWQQQQLSGDNLNRLLTFWRDTLQDCPAVHSLPLDFQRPATPGYHGGLVSNLFSAELTQQLEATAKQHGLTLHMLMHGILALVLSRHAGSSDILIGSPVANRNHHQVDGLMGFFLNMLTLRVNTDQPSLTDYLQHIKQVNTDALDYQDLPFELLVDELQPTRSTQHAPIFQIVYSHIDEANSLDESGFSLPGITLSAINDADNQVAKFDLTLSSYKVGGQLQLDVVYDTGLFTERTVQLLVRHVQTLAESVTATAVSSEENSGLSQLVMLSDDEKHAVLAAAHSSSLDDTTGSILQQIETQANQTPDQLAVIAGQHQLTYHALDSLSNQLAQHLIHEGTQPGDIVGVSVNRSTQLVVALLAIWKAGAAYLPLDTQYPTDRLLHMINDAGVTRILTSSDTGNLPDSAVTDSELQLINLATLNWTEASEERPVLTDDPTRAAYVIYTSGSTGLPKGVEISQQAIGHFINAACLQTGDLFSPASRCLAVTTINFDIAALELFGPLTAGGTVILAEQGDIAEPSALIALINQHDVNLMQATPASWQMLIDAGWQGHQLTALSGGEALPVSLLNWLEQHTQAVWNCYGPTEATVWSAMAQVSAVNVVQSVPLSGFLPGYDHFVLDSDGQLVAPGVPGELHIGGPALATGYLNRAELTAERFVSLTIDDQRQPLTLYKTGDLVRWIADETVTSKHEGSNGLSLEFLGRVDTQVKVRGYRIETGEIETALEAIDVINRAAVVVRGEGAAAYLAAFITVNSVTNPEPAALQQQLAAFLPGYMIPTVIQVLEALPLTNNGKLNRNALPESEFTADAGHYVAPETDTQQILCDIFSSVLGLEQVGIHDNFFTCGGHSLAALKVIAQVRAQLDVELPVHSLFDQPTVAGLAAILETSDGQSARQPVIAHNFEVDELVPASQSQARLWFIDTLQNDSTEYHMPAALRITGVFNTEAAEQALTNLVERHEVLRTVYLQQQEQVLQRVLPVEPFKIVRHDLTELPEQAQMQAVVELQQTHQQARFDLTADRMLRVSIIQLSQDEQILLFNLHHIAADGWSIDILLSEFSTLYRAAVNGESAQLSKLPVQYRDYAMWQQEVFSGELLETQLAYWKQTLADVPALHSLNTDFPRPLVSRHQGDVVRTVLDKTISEQLNQLAQSQGLTPFMLLHGALALVLSRNSHNYDCLIGTPMANRPDTAIAPLIGFFVNTLVLRTDTHDRSLADYLSHIRDVNLGAQAHQDIPFDLLVEHCTSHRSSQHSPLFQILLTTNTGEQSELALDGLTVEPLVNSAITTKFDLDIFALFGDDGLVINWTFDTDLFLRESIDLLSTQLLTLLGAMVQPEALAQPIHSLRLMCNETRAQLIERSTGPVVALEDELLHHKIERMCAQQPDALAAECEHQSLTYRVLNEQANQFAHWLIEQGVKPDDVVAVCLERSAELVISLLGILKAGAAFLPLDYTAPPARLRQLEQEANSVRVITDAEHLDVFENSILMTIALNSGTNITNPVVKSQNASHLAYMFYTSGSTGKPKGVQVPHSAIVNRLEWKQQEYVLTPADRVLQKTPYTFDVSIWEFFWTLREGATMILAKPEGHKDPRYLTQLIEAKQVSVLHFVPSMLSVYVQFETLPSSVRLLFCGGEAVKTALVNKVLTSSPHVTMNNLYGPTEAAIDVSYFDCSAAFEGKKISDINTGVPIGRPIQNTTLFVLDDAQQLLPPGAIGELCIGGMNLARGYANQPALTDERFISHPLANGGRLYRTGDLVRYLPDGNILFLGRIDEQVKLRGQRIEPGEVAHQLLKCQGVRDCAVLVRDDRLIAYVVTDDKSVTEQLSGLLAAKLPDYMVPSVFVNMEKLPVTVNGKLDRKALPKPEVERALYQAPSTDAELALCEVYAEVLELEQVGLQDNFFVLGGYSLLLMKATGLLREQGWDVAIADLFNATDVGVAAQRLKRLDQDENALPENAIPADANHITPAMLSLISLSQQDIDGITAQVPGGASNIKDMYPLAPLQQGLYFIHQSSVNGRDPYVLSTLIKLPTEDAYSIFIEALQQVISRHDVLRTLVLSDNLPQPVQVVLRDAPLTVSEVSADNDAALLTQMEAMNSAEHQWLDLTSAPCLAVTRGVNSDGSVLLAIQWHHIAMDHIALDVLIEEVNLIQQGQADTLMPARPYREFVARWQQRQSSESTAWFEQSLGDITEPTSLFEQLVEEQSATAQHATEEFEMMVPDELAATILQQSQQQHISPAVLFHLAWAMVAGQCSDRDDVVFGTVLAGRVLDHDKAQRSIGLFMNTLPLRLSLNQSVTSGILQVRSGLASLLNYEQTPLSQAQHASGVAAGVPLFNSLLNYRHEIHAAERHEGIETLGNFERTNYPFAVSIGEHQSGFKLVTQAHSIVGAGRINGYLINALRGILSSLEHGDSTPLNQLSVLSGEEQTQILESSTGDEVVVAPVLLHEQIEQYASQTPDAVAVVFEGESLTYQQLEQQSNQLAHVLIARGVSSDDIVGLCLERSLNLVVSMLAILKAGAAFLPFDTRAPQARLMQIERDAGVKLVLTYDLTHEHFNEGQLIDVLTREAETQAVTAPVTGKTSDQLAYVIYTSGSTGKPKGVQVSHSAIMNRMDWMQRQYALLASDKVLQKTPYTFDVSVWEFFWPLREGATLVVAKPDGHKDPQYIAELVRDEQVSVVHFVPSMLNIFVQQAELASSVRYLFCSGEALDGATVQAAIKKSPRIRVFNLYGPTEAAIEVSHYECTTGPKSGSVPIGKPIQNTSLLVANSQLNLVPDGAVGELLIGGANLAEGYLGQPELTAERFVAHPYKAGETLYRSGDLVRRLPTGDLIFIGRIDDQIKLHGLRIELGEIVQQCLACDGVTDGTVLVHEQRLVAYLVTNTQETTDEFEMRIRDHLSQHLADYMVPSAYVVLKALPLMVSGKLDRAALPAPVFATVEYVAPTTDAERALCDVFSEIFYVDTHDKNVGVHDNFFALGGHSLTAMKVIAALKQRGWQLNIVNLLSVASVAEVATFMTPVNVFTVPENRIPDHCDELTPDMLPLIDLTDSELRQIEQQVNGGASLIQDIYPLAPLQRGIYYHHQISDKTGDTYVVSTLLSFEQSQAADNFIAALNQVIARHDVLRTLILHRGLAQPVQVVLRQAELKVETLAADDDAKLQQLLDAETEAGNQWLDLTQAPVMSLQRAEDSTGKVWLVIKWHHVLMDHLAMDALVQDIQAFEAGRGAELPEIAQYRTFIARWLHDQANNSIEQASAWFEQQLQDISTPTLMFDLSEKQWLGVAATEFAINLSDELNADIRQVCDQFHITPATLFHLAWAVVAGRCSGQQDVVFGTVLAGRLSDAGQQHSVGLYMNTLPMRVSLQQSIEQGLAAVRQGLTSLIDHEQTPLTAALSASQLPASTPLFNSLLNYRHSFQALATTETPRQFEVLDSVDRTSYPVTLSVGESATGFRLNTQTKGDIAPQFVSKMVLQSLKQLLAGLMTDSAMPLSDISIIDNADQQALLQQVQGEQVVVSESLLHTSVEQQAEQTPDAVAVVFDDNVLTYQQLNQQANQLAHGLIARGVLPGDIVAVCLERSVELVVSLLAIVKAGAAYLPLDTAAPQARLAQIETDSSAKLVLTNDAGIKHFKMGVLVSDVLVSDVLNASNNEELFANPEISNLTPENLAYVIYTSGSTGQPKGVQISHHAIVNRLDWMQREYGLTASDNVLQKTPYTFDVSVWEFFWPLREGASLVLAKPDGHKDPGYLSSLINDAQISVLHFVPSMLNVFMQQTAFADSVRYLFCSGEALETATVETVKQQSPHVAMFNLYGPTEAAIDVSAFACAELFANDSGPFSSGSVPIGQAIQNTSLLVLDNQMNLVPDGAIGELYIGGDNLAKGYLGQPALTAERFVQHPFAANETLYRTGDLVRRLADGNLVFTGRADDQVKLHGLRIEPGEIVHQCLACEGITDAVVMVRDERLVAWLVASPGHASETEIRQQLSQQLPDYMVPSAFVWLDALPLTTNGKLNRKALPAPAIPTHQAYEAPVSDIEILLVDLWADLLNLDQQDISVHSNFFQLGGHSLLAITMLSRLEASLDLSLDVNAVFATDSLRALAVLIEQVNLQRSLQQHEVEEGSL